MTPTDFEILTQILLAKRLRKAFGYDIPVCHLKTFTSLTGNKYEIDLSYSFTLFDINYLTLVECKNWDSFVTREKIGYFKSIIDDLKAHKGLIITTKGFQRGAINYAQSQNIGLIKIINDKNFKAYSHADGGLALIDDFLIKEDTLNENLSHISFGLFFPCQKVNEFIRVHYGKDLADFLEKDYSPKILDNPSPYIKPIVRVQLLEIPETWYKDYILYETAGLNYKIQNEPELRLYNITISLLKYEFNNKP